VRVLDRLARRAREQRNGDLGEVADVRLQSLGMEHQRQHVGCPLSAHAPEHRVEIADHAEHARHGRVREHEVPGAVDDDRGVGFVVREQQLERSARGMHVHGFEAARRVDRREARRHEQAVALAQRQVERARELEHHLAARQRATRLEEAQVALRDVGLDGELELREPARAARAAQQLAEARVHGGGGGHRRHSGSGPAARPLPRG
jgi:hypothetical protein